MRCLVAWRGLKKDGSKKVRAVDHMTQSQVNASTVVQEKMRHQSLDEFYELMRIMVEATEVNPPKARA